MRLVAVLTILAGCSRPPSFAGLSTISLRGKAIYADNTPAAAVPIQFSLLASGEKLFPSEWVDCHPGDDHAQALQNVQVFTGPNGSFSLEAPITGFFRATDESCPMPPQAAANLSRIEVRAQANADFSSCLPYCRKHTEETCYADCAGRGQKFVWSHSLTAAEVGSTQGIHFDMLGPPIAGTPATEPALPDLQVNGEAARSSLRITEKTFAPTDCALEDGCIGAAGTRMLMRFDGDIQNLGDGDLRIGSPQDNPLFTYSACHKHYHLKNIMTFELLDETGAPAIGDSGRVVARKQGFCMLGLQQIAGDTPNLYDCENQGLATGWEDVYHSNLSCQWLDVTGVPGGDYALRITVNASRTFPESDFDNNSALIPVSIP